MSATFWAWALSSLKRIAQSMESEGVGSSEFIIASTELMSCFRVTRWVRAGSAILISLSRRSRPVSFNPERMCGPTDAFSINSRQLLPRVSKCPARFPLSTVETYLGSRGCRSRVSYQLNKCPWNSSIWFKVASVASSRSADSMMPIHPKSRAQTVERRYSPIFVGEVRCAITGLGVS